MALSDIRNPQSVSRAISEFDDLGRSGFLRKYGFKEARSYFLLDSGRQYDSKAILGAAHGFEFPDRGPLQPRDFHGGKNTVRRKLMELGFEVVFVSGPSESSVP